MSEEGLITGVVFLIFYALGFMRGKYE